MVDLTPVLGLPRCAVFALLDANRNICYINYAEDVLGAVARLELGGQALALQILSVTTDIETLKLHVNYWRDQYKGMGWGDMIAPRPHLQYRVKCGIDRDYEFVEVALVSARGSRKVVGKFKSMGEARDFIAWGFSSGNDYCLPVYAVNSLTRELMTDRIDSSRLVTI